MNLTDRLRQFIPQQQKQSTTKESTNLDPFLKGKEVQTPWGNCYIVQKHYPLSAKHGIWHLQNTTHINNGTFAKLGQSLSPHLKLEQMLFLDTETTGLAGGTGTYAFLVGVGRFTGEGFLVTQFLMRDYNEELALLYLIEQELKRSKVIISFNGKTFDLPLLKTRFAMARTDFSGPKDHEQLDLLHMARRLWRQKLTSCSLNSLERNLLGVQRINDIPGFEIPSRFFQFLQTGNGALLKDIVHHNQIDIISMVTLLHQIQIIAEQKPQECTCPWEAEALALMASNEQEALLYLRKARGLAKKSGHYVRLLHQTALIHKRLKDYQQASRFWQEILKLKEDDLVAYEELAKYHEHRSKDLKTADQITRQALAIALRNRSPKVAELEYRLQRLERKLSN